MACDWPMSLQDLSSLEYVNVLNIPRYASKFHAYGNVSQSCKSVDGTVDDIDVVCCAFSASNRLIYMIIYD